MQVVHFKVKGRRKSHVKIEIPTDEYNLEIAGTAAHSVARLRFIHYLVNASASMSCEL